MTTITKTLKSAAFCFFFISCAFAKTPLTKEERDSTQKEMVETIEKLRNSLSAAPDESAALDAETATLLFRRKDLLCLLNEIAIQEKHSSLDKARFIRHLAYLMDLYKREEQEELINIGKAYEKIHNTKENELLKKAFKVCIYPPRHSKQECSTMLGEYLADKGKNAGLIDAPEGDDLFMHNSPPRTGRHYIAQGLKGALSENGLPRPLPVEFIVDEDAIREEVLDDKVKDIIEELSALNKSTRS